MYIYIYIHTHFYVHIHSFAHVYRLASGQASNLPVRVAVLNKYVNCYRVFILCKLCTSAYQYCKCVSKAQ